MNDNGEDSFFIKNRNEIIRSSSRKRNNVSRGLHCDEVFCNIWRIIPPLGSFDFDTYTHREFLYKRHLPQLAPVSQVETKERKNGGGDGGLKKINKRREQNIFDAFRKLI